MSVSWIRALLVLGAALELVGLALVAWDVWDAWQQRRALARRDQLVQVPFVEHERALGGAKESGAAAPAPPVVLGPQLDQVQRDVFDLEQRLKAVIGVAAAGKVRRRALGAALFACGLIVQTVANFAAL